MVRARRVTLMMVFAPLLSVILLAGGPGSALAQAQPPSVLAEKHILVLHGHEANAPVFQDTDRALARTLQSGGVPILNQFFVSLDLRRNPDPEYRKLLVEYMRVLSRHRRFDLIVTMFPEALDFVLDEGPTTLPDTPILALYLPADTEPPKADRRIFYHAPVLDMLGTLEIAVKLVPGAKRVYVVSGAHPVDRQQEARARRDFKTWEGRLEFRYLGETPLDETLATLASAPDDAIVLLLPYTKDVTGKNYLAADLTQQVSQASVAPVFGLLEVGLGHGIVGGALFSFESVGTNAGRLALDIFRGSPASGSVAPVLNVPAVPMFDWRQLKRWNLDVDALPDGSIVVNKKLTLWDFRYYIIGALAFCLTETVLVVILIVQRRRRSAAEEALRASERQLRLMADSLPVLIAYIDREQRCRFNNLAYARWFGIPPDALRGAPVREVVGDKAYEAVRGYIERALAGEEVQFETELTTPDSSSRYVQALYVPHVDGRGGVRGFYALLHDMTEHRRIDLEIERQRDELAHVSRVATLGELTASLAHELHQPLAAIMSNAQAALRFLAQDEPDFQEVRDILQDIVADDRRANEVIQRLRLLLRRARPELAPLAINELIAEVLTLLKREVFLRGITIELHLDADLPPVVGDWVQLQQVVLNLVLNAADAMADGEPQSRRLIIRTERENEGKVRVAVRDFGTGLDGQNLHRLFEPFYSTKPEGLGMGLPICRSIVEAHGGQLWAANKPDRGATFMFTVRTSQGGEA
jgi:PAS domain S-box-containing protein